MQTNHLGEFWRLNRVEAECGVKKSFIYQHEKVGRFPRRIKVGRAAVWSSAQVEAWKQAQALGTEWSAS